MQMKRFTDNTKYLIWFWTLFILPFAFVILLFILISKEKLGPMPTFSELENPEYFKKVYVDGGTITWPNGYDFCPIYLRNEA